MYTQNVSFSSMSCCVLETVDIRFKWFVYAIYLPFENDSK